MIFSLFLEGAFIRRGAFIRGGVYFKIGDFREGVHSRGGVYSRKYGIQSVLLIFHFSSVNVCICTSIS